MLILWLKISWLWLMNALFHGFVTRRSRLTPIFHDFMAVCLLDNKDNIHIWALNCMNACMQTVQSNQVELPTIQISRFHLLCVFLSGTRHATLHLPRKECKQASGCVSVSASPALFHFDKHTFFLSWENSSISSFVFENRFEQEVLSQPNNK